MTEGRLGRSGTSPIVFGLVLVLYALTVAAYLRHPQMLQCIPGPGLKSLPILLLAVAALALGGRSTVLISAGLIASAVGDITIVFSFPMGMGAFLLAHIFYIVAFAGNRQYVGWRIWWLAPAVIWGIYMMYRLHSARSVGGPGLEIAVCAYIVVITAMFAFSILRRPSRFHLIPIGAAMFVISDSILAWNRFIARLPYTGDLVMLTYYAAQLLITAGALASLGDGAEATETHQLIY